MHATDIATGAPTWVYLLLAGLVALGVRRLRTREVPVVVALIPSAAFLIWSGLGLIGYAARFGVAPALIAGAVGLGIGVASAWALPEPRAALLPGGRVRQPGSPLPLILYLGVFAIRFACGAWAAIEPARAGLATGLGIVAGLAVTARLVAGVVRWRREVAMRAI